MVDGPGRTRPPLARLGGSAGLSPTRAGGTTAAARGGTVPSLFAAVSAAACVLLATLVGANLWALRLAAAMTAAEEEGQAGR